jgi:EAL domain-containing protein (putative c-di-GMP-specific phosphodiesterase class I)
VSLENRYGVCASSWVRIPRPPQAVAGWFTLFRSVLGVHALRHWGVLSARAGWSPIKVPFATADTSCVNLPHQRATPSSAALAEILTGQLVVPVFQPIVHMPTGRVVGYEALARGPEGSPLRAPDALFAAARADGVLAELDWLCRIRAMEAASDAGLVAPASLFINVEPEVAGLPPTPDLQSRLATVEGLRVVVEFTERSLTARPAQLLGMADQIRDRGWGIALDDVGADPASLALMPFLRPDVIKLDLRLIQDRPDLAAAEIMSAVAAYAERSGATILAEGIETVEHIAIAQALGATLGQGWHFGRPAELTTERVGQVASDAATRIPLTSAARLESAARSSLFAVAARQRTAKRSTKPLLIEVSKMLERQALQLKKTAVVLGAFEDAVYFTVPTSRRYETLAQSLAFVGALGKGLSPEPAPAVRGAQLRHDDPVIGEWHIVVVSPHFYAALIAQDLGDTGPDDQRRFDFILTYDPVLVTQMATGLLARMLPSHAYETATGIPTVALAA